MVKTTIDIDDSLWKKFSMQIIRKKGFRKKNEVIEQLIRDYIKSESQYDVSKAMLDFEEEKSAFEKIRDSLAKDESYRGKYVAIMQGKVIDSDPDKVKLVERIYKKQGYVPLFIGFVGHQKPVEVPSPELLRRHEVRHA
jgi:hypothetical protein